MVQATTQAETMMMMMARTSCDHHCGAADRGGYHHGAAVARDAAVPVTHQKRKPPFAERGSLADDQLTTALRNNPRRLFQQEPPIP
jgi:hypothetical protein